MRRSSKILGTVIGLLALLTLVLWHAALSQSQSALRVSFLDVGQGDAIFIQAPGGRQALIDGGTGTAVLRALAREMPWYDRSIDVVIATHPDQDHIGGLIDVLARYRVAAVFQSSVFGSTATWDAFERAIEREGALVREAERGHIIDLGGGAYIEVLFPDRPVAHVETNIGCVVTRVVYGTTSFLLPCDTSAGVEAYLAALDRADLHADVLKAAHHGSKTSSSPDFIGMVNPSYVIFSRGCDNSYGHPSPEIVARYEQFRIPALDTCKEGTITFVSDGQTMSRR